jgi:low affinity Fe/Cu permease
MKIVRSIQLARNEMIDIEKLSDEELAALAQPYERIRQESEQRKARRAA